jgi:hypothetical protein
VSEHPEVMVEYPVAALAEEITTEGTGRVRGVVTLAGNPVLSTPNSQQLAEALDDLEFMVSIDMYLNETTRHADVILPPPSQLQRGHYDVLLLQFAVRNVANYSEAVLPLDEGQPDEWEIISKLTLVAQGLGVDADPAVADEMMIDGMVRGAVKDDRSPVGGRDADQLLAELAAGARRGTARILDFMLRTGPYGDGFGVDPNGTSLDDLLGNPHGRDFGPLVERLPDILRTPSGKVELDVNDNPSLELDMGKLLADRSLPAATKSGEVAAVVRLGQAPPAGSRSRIGVKLSDNHGRVSERAEVTLEFGQ